MTEHVDPIPEGYSSLTPHLVIRGAAKAIEFYKQAFDAEEICRMPAPDGERLMHAEIRIGNSHLMICDEFAEWGQARSPETLGGSPITLALYVPNVDDVFARAVEAGGKEVMAVADQFWGDRYGKLVDPFGHEWSVATHIKNVTPEEMNAAAEACMSQGAASE